MSLLNFIRISLITVLVIGCTVEFNPGFDENEEFLVVEGMITDQNRVNRIKLSRSLPIGKPLSDKTVKGALVTITDENNVVTLLIESPEGVYSTDSTEFRGRVGGQYSLNIKLDSKNYATDFVEMKPVPHINSLYYEKVTITASRDSNYIKEGCRIYVDSYDPSGRCLYFRWDFVETWEYRIPYNVINKICYVTERSDEILVKNTSQYSSARVTKYPVLFISNTSDRLKEKYSILVNQYSLTGQEFAFWEQVRNISANVGNLYDITPTAIQGNIKCTTDQNETVLGYFSVSSMTQKRLFIQDQFLGLPLFFVFCATDTIVGYLPDTGLNSEYWVIEDYGDEPVPFWIITTYKECADCTTRGTNIMPSFWNDYINDKR